MTPIRYHCPVCGKVSIPMDTRAEATYFAAFHERLHHSGAPVTTLTRDHPTPTTQAPNPATTTPTEPTPTTSPPPPPTAPAPAVPPAIGTAAGSVCESCRHAVATTSWAHPDAGQPFTLCTDCAALIPITITRATPTARRATATSGYSVPVAGAR